MIAIITVNTMFRVFESSCPGSCTCQNTAKSGLLQIVKTVFLSESLCVVSACVATRTHGLKKP